MHGRDGLLELFRTWDDRSEPIDLQELTAELGRLVLDRGDLIEAVGFDDRIYRRIAVRRRAHYEALVLCWKSGQGSPIHDHLGSTCVVRVVEGRATETLYRPSPCGLLVPAKSQVLAAGSVTGCRDHAVHQMANLEPPGQDLITLHVYSPPPSAWRYYTLDKTTLADHDSLIPRRSEALVVDLRPSRTLRVDGPEPPGNHFMNSPIPTTTISAAATAVPAEPVVAIIGGGFSGTMVAAQLVRQTAGRPVRILLMEKGERFSRGLAYGTRCDGHLLNVPAGMMSAFPDQPSHFHDWLAARDATAHPGTFAPRKVYGEYLESLLQAAIRDSQGRLELVRDEVVDMTAPAGDGPFQLTTRQGAIIEPDRVVLALGHMPPQDPTGGRARAVHGFVADPWAPGILDDVVADDELLLIGTGLTAVDLIVEARDRGHRGPIMAISRHGLRPCGHRPTVPRPHIALGDGPRTARTLVRSVRREAAICQSEGGDWRSVVDALRPVLPTLWQSLGDAEKSRFVRHVASRWDVHRHRVAPEIESLLHQAESEGRLAVVAGRVVSMAHRDGKVVVRYCRRGRNEPETRPFRKVINCTGPGRDIRSGDSPLLKALFERGLVRPGPLALGLDVTENATLIDQGGRPHDRLFAIGPVLKDALWETTAVRELRVQALELAGRLGV